MLFFSQSGKEVRIAFTEECNRFTLSLLGGENTPSLHQKAMK